MLSELDAGMGPTRKNGRCTQDYKVANGFIKLLIQIVYDVLPSLFKVHRQSIAKTPACPFYQEGTIDHTLNCCTMALGEGMTLECSIDYCTWRSGAWTMALGKGLGGGMSKSLRPSMNSLVQNWCGQNSFIPPRKPSHSSEMESRQSQSQLGLAKTSARDWQLLVDLKQQLKFPSHIVVTTLRPDRLDQLLLLEIKLPWEERFDEAFQWKLSKYAGLVSDCQQAGWRSGKWRGLTASSLARALSS